MDEERHEQFPLVTPFTYRDNDEKARTSAGLKNMCDDVTAAKTQQPKELAPPVSEGALSLFL